MTLDIELRGGRCLSYVGREGSDDNKAIFQKEYLAELDLGKTSDVAKLRAAEKTPFVTARGRRGYTKIDVDIVTTKKAVVGDPPKLRDIPGTVHVVTRKP